MTVKAAYKYMLRDQSRALIIFYGIIFLLQAAVLLGFTRISVSGSSSLGGFDAATLIFLFVAGLCSFKENFLLLTQNGVSRRSLFKAWLLVALSVALLAAAADRIILFLCRLCASLVSPNLSCHSFVEQSYGSLLAGNGFLAWTQVFIFSLLLYLTVLAGGYLITLVYYRLPRRGKIAVSVGVPVGLFTVLPMLDAALCNGAIGRAALRFFTFAFGIQPPSAAAAPLTLAAMFVILSALGWLLVRRAAVKA